MNGVCYSEHYVEATAQQVESCISACMVYVTVNIVWKLLHSSGVVEWQVELCVLVLALCGR